MENVIIVGSGISGLTAAVYTARANLNPIILTGIEDGGQLTLTTDVDNFPGFPEGVMGPDLVARAKKQAERFGAKVITENAESVTVNEEDGKKVFTVKTNANEYKAKVVIVSTGASARWLGLESEKQFQGKGVSTCATCDGAFYKGKIVAVVGGGDSAMEESNFLTRFAEKVYVVHRRDKLRASKIMQDKAFNNPKIEIKWNLVVDEILGDEKLGVTGVKLKSTAGGEDEELKLDGVFLALGHIPNTKMFSGMLDMDDHGYLKTDRFMHTNVEGVFACGDVQDTRYRQAITAAGSGCQAAIEAEKYIEKVWE